MHVIKSMSVCAFVSGLAWFSLPAQAAGGPTYSATIATSINGATSPQEFGKADWTTSGHTYDLQAKLIAPPVGRTVLVATWHTGLVTVKKGQELLDASVDLRDQPGVGGASATIVQEFRTCVKKHPCGRWHRLVEQIAPFIDVQNLLGGTSGGGAGVSTMWEDGKAIVDIQWQLVVTGTDGGVTTLDASVVR